MKRFNEPWFDDSKSSRQFGKWVMRLFFVLLTVVIILTLMQGGDAPYTTNVHEKSGSRQKVQASKQGILKRRLPPPIVTNHKRNFYPEVSNA